MRPELSAEEVLERRGVRAAGQAVASNSLGLAYSVGDVWDCSLCGQSGPDSSHGPLSHCPKTRSGAHQMTYTTRGRAWVSTLEVL